MVVLVHTHDIQSLAVNHLYGLELFTKPIAQVSAFHPSLISGRPKCTPKPKITSTIVLEVI